MKLGFKIFIFVGLSAAAFFNSIDPSINKGVDMKSIVACKDCDK